jgi:hypothetical protein
MPTTFKFPSADTNKPAEQIQQESYDRQVTCGVGDADINQPKLPENPFRLNLEFEYTVLKKHCPGTFLIFFLFALQFSSVMNSKGTSLLGSGATAMPSEVTSFRSIHNSVCSNARAAVVEKQVGADPTLPGPGQYINPMTEGRNSRGEIKATLSTQHATHSVKFCGPTPPQDPGRSMAKPGSDKEPGPGQYINPLTYGRGPDGEVRRPLLP